MEMLSALLAFYEEIHWLFLYFLLSKPKEIVEQSAELLVMLSIMTLI